MSREHLLMAVLAAAMSITPLCSGFNPERSANVPGPWNIVPSLETEQKITVDHSSSSKSDVTVIDKALQVSDTKMSTKTVEQTSPADVTREKRFDFTMENTDKDTRSPVAVELVSSVPKNVIMIIAEAGQDQKDFWKNFKASHLFHVVGTLQGCDNGAAEKSRFSLDSAFTSGSKDKKRECEHFLRSNIASLLLWARDVKGMSIGTLSNTNFTIPSLFGFEESVGLAKEFEDMDENNMKLEVHKPKPEIYSDWHVIDLAKPTGHAPSLMPASNIQEDDEAAWNVFNMFSKIRLVLFRSLLESLSGNVAATEDPIPSRKSHLLRSNLVDMMTELKSVENEKGFILVAMVPTSELNSAFELLQREMSQGTLLVVIITCSHDDKPVPFFAQGPSARMLHETTMIWDVPNVIRQVIASGCQDANCRARRHVFPPLITQSKDDPHSITLLRRSSRDTAKNSDDEKVPEVPAAQKKDVSTKNEKNGEEQGKRKAKDEKDVSPKAANVNSANYKMAEKLTTTFGIAVSMLGAFTLTA
ncbi:PREDICTED: uncharacterized protein LOC108555233 [Eufriesea mexicana]|uniref:uncharacterized protein LOC108555233 n=1 Tax=Eufriesea mexicana TaxID=516756 RepID=UPI00083C332D|nr:PREDICTED: uncharacterized protein LOC108555233 [Eufriesea mexicana]